jgi:pseudaminic acid cytidylyltransferase
MNIAIIPARYGSKRIKFKNIKSFYSNPMIFWTIKQLMKSKIFDLIVVTSDSEKILTISKRSGANILIKRPKKLSDDKSPTRPVIIHAINYLKKRGIKDLNSICCVYPCNPFIFVNDLKMAFKIFKKDNSKFVFPITEYSHPIQRALRLTSYLDVKPVFKKNINKRTQDFKKTYYDAGQFYFGSEMLWKSRKTCHEHGRSIIIPSWRTIDIDNVSDWKRAELLFKTYKIL